MRKKKLKRNKTETEKREKLTPRAHRRQKSGERSHHSHASHRSKRATDKVRLDERPVLPMLDEAAHENGADEDTPLVLYWAPNSPSPNMVALFLQALGVPYRSVQFQWQDASQRENRSMPEYWRLNANRAIPTLVDGDFVLTERYTV